MGCAGVRCGLLFAVWISEKFGKEGSLVVLRLGGVIKYVCIGNIALK
jgi:hypothetical protein